MYRIGFLLLGMASLVASGVIMDAGRYNPDLNMYGGIDLKADYGIRRGLSSIGVGQSGVFTKNDLIRQKFILDILYQVYAPLQQHDLLMLDDLNIITNENLYTRPLTKEMHMMLELIATNQIVGKQAIFNVNDENHMRQTVGFYRLLVNAGDFDTFQRLVVYARRNLNTEIFVHCFILALGERQDTQMLIVPALYEILPQLYVKDQYINQVRNLDTGVSTAKPQLFDVIGMNRRNMMFNPQIFDQQQGGFFGILNKSQLWMPWRELHKQISVRKMMGGNILQQDDTQMNKLTVSLPSNGLLCQDIGLKSYFAILIDELILNQDTIRNSDNNRFGFGGQGYGKNEEMFGRQGNLDFNNIINGFKRNEMNSQNGYIADGKTFNSYQGETYNDRFLNSQYGENRFAGQDIHINNIKAERRYDNFRNEDDSIIGGNVRKSYYAPDDEYDTRRNMFMGQRNMQESQNGFNTVSANDARLLFVGRRNKNPNSVVNMDFNRYNAYADDEDLISGGRSVSKDERQSKKYNYYGQDYVKNDQYANYYENDFNNDDDDSFVNKYQYRGYGMNPNNYRDNLQNKQANDYFYRSYRGQDQSLPGGFGSHGRDEFLNTVTRGYEDYGDQRQYFDNDQDTFYNPARFASQYNGESLDMQMPTTSVNDERLLYTNRRKFNNIEEVNVDNERYAMQRPYYGEQQQKDFDTIRRDKQNGYAGERYTDSDSDKRKTKNQGRRPTRSIVNQEFDQTNTFNGKLMLHNLQQIVARLNLERIALGQPQLIDNTRNNFGRDLLTNNLVGQSNIQGVSAQTMNKIENIFQQIDRVLQQKIGQISASSYNQKLNEIGLILAGQIQDLGLVDILGEVFQQTYPQLRKGLIANAIENEIVQILLAGIVKVVDNKVQQLYNQREEFISTVHGVTINNVEVDQFQTYLEQTDIDLTNLLNTNSKIDEPVQGRNKMVVGRVPRLNHKSFNILVDVTSDRQQQVVVRNFLVPKVDGQNNMIPFVERRQNAIVLDITTIQLQQGRNTLKLKSNDITVTSRDTTPLTKIYQIVMQALNGDITLQHNVLAGQTTLLPHRLLLPRGRINGLPMQLITVITPVQGSSSQETTTGFNALTLDRLPLNYPLHCDITDFDKVTSMPNLMVKDVKIYHDDKIQTPFERLY